MIGDYNTIDAGLRCLNDHKNAPPNFGEIAPGAASLQIILGAIFP
jgi:hypothetical protein